MNLQHIVDALGGELYDGKMRASVPGPNHSAEDRSVSLLLQDGRVVVNTFGRTGWRDVLDDLRKRNLIDRDNAPINAPGVRVTGRPSATAPTDRERLEAARRVWGAGRHLGTSLAAQHCRLRGLTGPLPGPEALRYLHDAPISAYRPGRARRPALLAGILDPSGVLVAVEVTYLAPNAKRAMDLRLPRKTIGVPPATGCAVRLDPPAERMLVGEGVFQTRAASEWFGLPGWALQSTRNLRGWTPPPGVRHVLIAGDRGVEGERSAEILRKRIVGLGLESEVALPPLPYPQWDQWACRPALATG
jgi:putative DNA primase/helicase